VWFVKGVPSRMGYLLDISPKDLDRVLYFASSIVTWVDREERANDIDSLRDQVEEEIRQLEEERDEEVLQTQALRTKRESVIKGESSPDELTRSMRRSSRRSAKRRSSGSTKRPKRLSRMSSVPLTSK
jgi:DNA-directed RNA polymerase subunit beta'